MRAKSRQLLTTARSRVESAGCFEPIRARLTRLATREIAMVEWIWRWTQHRGVRQTASLISWLGNGIMYPVAAIALLMTVTDAMRPVGIAMLSVAIGHIVYPWLKLACARLRPFRLNEQLVPRRLPLDVHSFPSGHVMTLTAALVPLVAAYRFIWQEALFVWLAMSWSRIGSGHHYPSDIVAGGTLGLAIAAPITWWLGY